MCQDDVLCPGAISAQVRLMRDNPSASLSIGNTYVIDSEGGVIMKRHRFGKDMIINGKSYARKSFYGRNIYSEPPNALYYTKDFYKIGKYDSSLTYTPDWDFTARLSYLGDICCSEAYIMQFRISDSSETSRIYSKRLASSIKDSDMLIDKHKKMRCIRISFFGAAFFKLVIRIAAVARLLVLSRKKSIKQ
jgi:hypothetical protein